MDYTGENRFVRKHSEIFVRTRTSLTFWRCWAVEKHDIMFGVPSVRVLQTSHTSIPVLSAVQKTMCWNDSVQNTQCNQSWMITFSIACSLLSWLDANLDGIVHNALHAHEDPHVFRCYTQRLSNSVVTLPQVSVLLGMPVLPQELKRTKCNWSRWNIRARAF